MFSLPFPQKRRSLNRFAGIRLCKTQHVRRDRIDWNSSKDHISQLISRGDPMRFDEIDSANTQSEWCIIDIAHDQSNCDPSFDEDTRLSVPRVRLIIVKKISDANWKLFKISLHLSRGGITPVLKTQLCSRLESVGWSENQEPTCSFSPTFWWTGFPRKCLRRGASRLCLRQALLVWLPIFAIRVVIVVVGVLYQLRFCCNSSSGRSESASTRREKNSKCIIRCCLVWQLRGFSANLRRGKIDIPRATVLNSWMCTDRGSLNELKSPGL